jgi:hypothetical protein
MTDTSIKADRFSNRAPKGGAVSLVNGQFYLGGQFMPMVATTVPVKPATLEGSARQVVWANRLRREALASLSDEIHVRTIFLNESKTEVEARIYRTAVKPLLIARHDLMTERSAASIIDRRATLS